jgi:hypothetical protein
MVADIGVASDCRGAYVRAPGMGRGSGIGRGGWMSLQRCRSEESLCSTVKSKQKDGWQCAVADEAVSQKEMRERGRTEEFVTERLVETRHRDWQRRHVGTLGRVRRRDNGVAARRRKKRQVEMQGWVPRRDNGVAGGDGEDVGRLESAWHKAGRDVA